MSTTTETKGLRGAEFVIKDAKAKDIFIPEEWSEEQVMIGQSTLDFLEAEVHPILDRIDSLEEGLMSSLMEKVGELGLLGISTPEELGGLGMDFNTSMLVAERVGIGFSFSVAFICHTGIGTLPILYYGTEEQKKKYIPKLSSGEWKGSYCLTEPSSGSDANSGKTKATLSADGKHYIINGQKMWITNAGFADVFTVFAKIDDDKNLTAFICEKGMEGLTLNAEEKKMGIKGSSTRQVFFNNVKVPVENLLGERQGGFKIAVNILNIGRIKLGASTLGAAKGSSGIAIKYANEREQFGRPISKYGAIRHKLAEMAVQIYAAEAATYRASDDIEKAIQSNIAEGMDKTAALLKGVEEFAVECAILKVVGSEVLDYVVDEGVQIHGGMGFSAESLIEKAYRDSRINRIFEGTNEINRMLTVDMIMRKAMKGTLDLMGPAMAIQQELTSVPSMETPGTGILEPYKAAVAGMKKTLLMVAGAAAQQLMQSMAKEQEILMNIADIVNDVYVAESVLLRVEKLLETKSEEELKEKIAMMQVYIYDALDRVNKNGKDAINSFAQGDMAKMMVMGLKRFLKPISLNVKEARQIVAQKMIAENQYPF